MSLAQNGSIAQSNVSAAFWADLLADGARRDWKSPSARTAQSAAMGNVDIALPLALDRLHAVGDAFLRVSRRFAGEAGRMSEQIHRCVVRVVLFTGAEYAYELENRFAMHPQTGGRLMATGRTGRRSARGI